MLSLEQRFVKSRISIVKIDKFVGGNLYHFRCLQVQLQFSWFICLVGWKQWEKIISVIRGVRVHLIHDLIESTWNRVHLTWLLISEHIENWDLRFTSPQNKNDHS